MGQSYWGIGRESAAYCPNSTHTQRNTAAMSFLGICYARDDSGHGFAASLAESLRLSGQSHLVVKREALPRQSLVRQSLTLRKRLGSIGKPEAFRKGSGKAAIGIG